MEYLLSVIIAFPLIASVVGFNIEERVAKIFGIVASGIELALVLGLWVGFDSTSHQLQFEHLVVLVESLGIFYHIGVDGISLFLIVLSAIVVFLSAIYIGRYKLQNHFVASLLALEGILMGVFSAQSVLLFYIFWELSLLPLLYMIGVWGSSSHSENIKSALTFFLYTFFASLIMLLGIIYYAYLFFLHNKFWSFELSDWYALSLPSEYQCWLFLAFFFAIAVKIPMIPFHSWLPKTYGNAPTIGTVLLSALLLKMGTYALVRFSVPLFPDASVDFELLILSLGLVMIIYGGIIAYANKDIKQVIAYSSISHMGVVVLGVFSFSVVGVGGAVFMMFAHGIVSAMLFMLVGIIEDKYAQMCNEDFSKSSAESKNGIASKIIEGRNIANFGGLARVAPVLCGVFGIAMMANVGLPLSIGFVGEFFSLLGVFKNYPIIAFLGGFTIIISAVYMLVLYKKIFFGELKNTKLEIFTDLDSTQKSIMAVFVGLVIFFGVYPKPLLKSIEASAQSTLQVAYERAHNDKSKERIEYNLYPYSRKMEIIPTIPNDVLNLQEGIQEFDEFREIRESLNQNTEDLSESSAKPNPQNDAQSTTQFGTQPNSQSSVQSTTQSATQPTTQLDISPATPATQEKKSQMER